MKSKTTTLLSTAFLALVFALQGQAADDKTNLDATDTKFIKKAAEDGMGELKIATLGTQKAERADVKEFATTLVTDHTKVNEELAMLAKQKGVETSQVISADAASKFKDLEKESGKSFDDAFLAHMEKDHKKDIDAFEDAEKNAKDGDVKSWAGKTLPTLRAHLQKVKELRGK